MIVWLIVLGIVAVAVGIVVGTGLHERRMDKEVANTAGWLETEATIQDARRERVDRNTWYPSFAFSYSVHGEYFSGRFFLKANREQSDELVKALIGHKFPVEYDPNNQS